MDNQLQPGGIISPSQPPTPQPIATAGTTSQPEGQTMASPQVQPMPAPSTMPAPALVNSFQPAQQPTQAYAPTPQPMQPVQPMPAFMNPGPMAPQPMNAQPAYAQPGMPAAPVANKSGLKKKMMPILIVLAAFVLIGGGTAGAYFGVVVPNKPENKLISAIGDLVTETNITTEGTVDYTSSDGGLAVSATFKSAGNTTKNQLSTSGTVGFKGTQFPYELRYIDKSMFVKIGGLSNLSKFIPLSAGGVDYSGIIKEVDNKWYVIDSTFVDTLGVKSSCFTDISFALSKDDIALVKSAYKQHPLFKVKSSSEEAVDGTPTTKYIVDPSSDSEASAFASGLKNLSIVKKAKECLGSAADSMSSSSVTSTINSAKDGATNSIAFFVSKDKKIKKIELTSKDKTANVKMQAIMSYAPVTITKPDGAKPLQDLYATLFGQTFAPIQTGAKDVERETDIKALHGQLEAYYNQFGYYPSLKDLNNTSFVAANLKGLDKEALKDPAGSNYTLTQGLQKDSYSYAVKPLNCDNATKTQCLSYVLTAVLEDGTTYTKESLNN